MRTAPSANALRRAGTSPLLPLVALCAAAVAVLAGGHATAALCAAAALAGVSLSGST